MKNIITILVLVLLALPVSAQFVEQPQTRPDIVKDSYGAPAAETPFSLLDLSRIKWSHSYSVTYFSGGIGSSSLGIFNTTMFYELSSKLSLNMNLGIAHDPSSLWTDGKTSNTTFLPGFTLDYHPSKKFQMSFSYQQYMGNPYYSPNYYRRGLFSNR
ncbi:MAG: hypothetical protein IIA17_10070 [candidate division Zixibacteria bacterium]|nr:hypothetical protein [candidate division Zixibacteria bacterium]